MPADKTHLRNRYKGILDVNEEGKFEVDMEKYNKTVLAQTKQTAKVTNALDIHGSQVQFSTYTANKNIKEEKPVTADGIEMGYQIERGVVPIIYGHVGMSSTQYDKGQILSELDSSKVRQTIRIPLSEGPIVGLSYQDPATVIDNTNVYVTPGIANPEHAKAVLINRKHIVDPTTDKANYEDVDVVVTKGAGNTTNYQTFSITQYEPIIANPSTGALDVPIEVEEQKTFINDLSDVQATDKGPDSIIYWNSDNGQWESKSLSEMMRDAQVTVTGGTGGTGGSGGGGGDGGQGGSGGVGSFAEAIYYTQWNPPPTHVRVQYSGTGQPVDETSVVTTTTTTDPEELPAQITPHGAPLRNIDQVTPEFSCNMSFANVDEKVKEISIITNFPDGLYKEIKTETETKTNPNPHEDLHHEIKICDTIREPLVAMGSSLKDARGTVQSDGGGNLECLLPDIEIVTIAGGGASESYEKATTITKTTGHVWVRYVLTTELCDREFVLDEGTYEISGLEVSAYEHKETLALENMNAGSRTVLTGDLRGTHQLGPFSDDENANCDTTLVEDYNWSEYDLEDYLDMYPGQIINSVTGESKIKIYTWIENRYFYNDTTLNEEGRIKIDDYRLSTNCYFKEVRIEKPMDVFGDYYSTGTTVLTKPFHKSEPNHKWRWGRRLGGQDDNNFKATLNTKAFELEDKRIQAGLAGGQYLDFSYPVPLAIMANINPGSSGGTGSGGDTGDSGVVGSPGQTGTVTVPVVEPIPTVDCSKSTYDSTIASQTITLGNITVANTDAAMINTLTISVAATTGTLFPNPPLASGVTVVSGTNTETLVLSGTAAALQNTLTTGIRLAVASSASGTLELNNYIIGTGSKGTRKICQILDIPERDTNTSRLHHDTNSFVKPVPAGALLRNTIAWVDMAYRPKQDEEELKLEELQFIVGGRDDMEAPSENDLSLSLWIDADYTSTTKNWTNNTAWVFCDYLTNENYGLGLDIVMDAEQKETLAIEVYKAAQWCSHIPTGSTVPASTFDGVIHGAESKIEALQKIAGQMHSRLRFINGNPRLVSDFMSHSWTSDTYTHTPTVKKIVNQTNAANLTYVGGSMENIFNVVNVKWNNPTNYHKSEIVRYENAASITKYSEREQGLETFGCANEQQAMWTGAWYFETNQSNTDTVSYMAGWDHYDTIPGDLICLVDEYRPDSSDKGGRVASVNGSTLTLDRDAGSGNIAVMDSLGVVLYGTASGTTATVTGGAIIPGAVWNVYQGDDEPQGANYRIIAIEESEDGMYAVSAGKYDPAKYDRVWTNTI